MNQPILIENVEQLNFLLELNSQVDCYITLKGNARSSKSIWYEEDTKLYVIFNEIDESEQKLSSEELFNEDLTFIGSAMNTKNLVLYDYVLKEDELKKYIMFKQGIEL